MSEDSRHIEDLVRKVVQDVLTEQAANPLSSGTFKCSKTLSDVIKDKKLTLKEAEAGAVSGEISMSITKSLTSRSRESYRPTESQLAMINKTAKEDQNEQSGYVFTFQATNLYNRPDRRRDAFSNLALNTMASQAVANTIPFLLASEADCEDHTWKAINSYGYVFDANVKDGGLYYETYIPDNSTTKGVLERVFSGQVNKLSVGFALKPADVLCSACKDKSIFDDSCKHEVGMIGEDGKEVYAIISKTSDNYEISGVAVPCQAEAKITRSLQEAGEGFTKSLGSVTSLGREYLGNSLFSVSGSPVVTSGTLKLSEIGKINNGKNTIEDNSPMDVENQEVQVETAAIEAEKPQTADASADDRLCKVAENVKTQAVKEISEVVKAMVDESTKSVFSKLDELEKSLKKIKKSIKKTAKKYQAELELQASVPGSQSLVDASRASGQNPLSASADKLLEQVATQASDKDAPEGFLGPILRP